MSEFFDSRRKKAGKDNKYNTDENTEIIKAHAFDYDLYLENELRENELSFLHTRSFAVFLDEGIVSHPDHLYLGVEPYCSKDIYYPQINNFFR